MSSTKRETYRHRVPSAADTLACVLSVIVILASGWLGAGLVGHVFGQPGALDSPAELTPLSGQFSVSEADTLVALWASVVLLLLVLAIALLLLSPRQMADLLAARAQRSAILAAVPAAGHRSTARVEPPFLPTVEGLILDQADRADRRRTFTGDGRRSRTRL